MATDKPGPDHEADAWLDGLAGRGGDGRAAREGARLRDAIRKGMPEKPPVPWAEIEARARRPEAADAAPTPSPPRHAHAANQSHWWRQAAWAAGALVAGVATVWQLLPGKPESPPELRGGSPTAEAQWRTADPARDSGALADELRHLGAVVQLSTAEGTTWLRIEVPETARAAVNARLAVLDLALDGEGRLRLQAMPR